jgi:hypothetical protein
LREPKRRESHQLIMDASGAKWVSGYTKSVDWLPSTFLDLMLVIDIFATQHGQTDGRTARLKQRASEFFDLYEQAARSLGFSALAATSSGERLYPAALHQ